VRWSFAGVLVCGAATAVVMGVVALVIYLSRGLDSAIGTLKRAVAADPGLADAHARLAEAYERKGDRDGRQAHLRQALALDPQNVLAAAMVARDLEDEGQEDGKQRAGNSPSAASDR
jgi:tetratricopeptide (TPR) repeat protein